MANRTLTRWRAYQTRHPVRAFIWISGALLALMALVAFAQGPLVPDLPRENNAALYRDAHELGTEQRALLAPIIGRWSENCAIESASGVKELRIKPDGQVALRLVKQAQRRQAFVDAVARQGAGLALTLIAPTDGIPVGTATQIAMAVDDSGPMLTGTWRMRFVSIEQDGDVFAFKGNPGLGSQLAEYGASNPFRLNHCR